MPGDQLAAGQGSEREATVAYIRTEGWVGGGGFRVCSVGGTRLDMRQDAEQSVVL